MSPHTKGGTPWEGATLSGAMRLLELRGKETRSDAATVRRRFEETARSYGAHLSLLEALGVAERDAGGTRGAGERGGTRKRRELNEGELARRLLSSGHEIGRHARAVVARALRRGPGEKDEQGPMYPTERNLLLEAGVLRVDHDSAVCEVTQEWHAECVSAAFCRGQSPTALEETLKRQADMGLRAERAVLEYERSQVREEDRARVIHVAAQSTSAGFDIASVRWNEARDQLETRLIEVKAVGNAGWSFVWSSHEREVARSWGRQYFIYLVPIRKGRVDTEEMMMIDDPIREFRGDNGWVIAEGDWTVQRELTG